MRCVLNGKFCLHFLKLTDAFWTNDAIFRLLKVVKELSVAFLRYYYGLKVAIHILLSAGSVAPISLQSPFLAFEDRGSGLFLTEKKATVKQFWWIWADCFNCCESQRSIKIFFPSCCCQKCRSLSHLHSKNCLVVELQAKLTSEMKITSWITKI